jgi:hypothetical protein
VEPLTAARTIFANLGALPLLREAEGLLAVAG